jgi:glycosyltransferase involved in cell wall biosynthesis
MVFDSTNPHAADDPTSSTCPVCGTALAEPLPPAPELLRRWLGEAAARRLGVYPIPAELRVSVVVPVYNEQETLGEVVRRIRSVPVPTQIILVDDGSTDGTREILAALEDDEDVTVVYHPENRGKGAALRTGFAHTAGQIVLVQDADLEYDPAQYPLLIQPILSGEADVVYGSRFLGGEARRVLDFWHAAANRLLTTLSNVLTNLSLTDMETCYKVFRREVIERLRPTLKETRFGIEPELTAKIARRRYRVFEVGIGYCGRTPAAGKKVRSRDFFRALWCIVRYWKWD